MSLRTKIANNFLNIVVTTALLISAIYVFARHNVIENCNRTANEKASQVRNPGDATELYTVKEFAFDNCIRESGFVR